MKPEPLKGKKLTAWEIHDLGQLREYTGVYFMDIDIRNAIEWYKKYSRIAYDNPYYQEWIEYRKDKMKCPAQFYLPFKTWILNKAFEDVMK